MKGVGLRLVGLGLWGLSWVLRVCPARCTRSLGRGLGWAWYRLVPVRRAVARENVTHALGLHGRERERVVRQMYLHLGQSFTEFLRYAGASVNQLPVKVQDRARLDAAIDAGRGVILVTAHLGNWELLVRSGALVKGPVMVVSKALESAGAHALWMNRRAGGAEIVFPEGSARRLVRCLRRKGVVGYVLDQHTPSPRAVWMPFFGRLAGTSPDVVRLARTTGATVLPVFIRRVSGEHVIDVGAPISMPSTGNRRADEIEGTRRCLVAIEAAIRKTPEQWLWIHRRWKTPPSELGDGLAVDGGGEGLVTALTEGDDGGQRWASS